MLTIQNLSTTDWTQLGGNALTIGVVEALGDGVELAITSAAPAAGAGGFSLPSGTALTIPNLAALGGRLYVRASQAGRSVRYVVA